MIDSDYSFFVSTPEKLHASLFPQLIILVNATSAAQYRVLAADKEHLFELEDGIPVQIFGDMLCSR